MAQRSRPSRFRSWRTIGTSSREMTSDPMVRPSSCPSVAIRSPALGGGGDFSVTARGEFCITDDSRHEAIRVRSPRLRTTLPLHVLARRPSFDARPDPRAPAWPCSSGRPAHHPHLGHVAGCPIQRCDSHCQHHSIGKLLNRRALQIRAVEGQGSHPEGSQQPGPSELDLACWLQHDPGSVALRSDVRKRHGSRGAENKLPGWVVLFPRVRDSPNYV